MSDLLEMTALITAEKGKGSELKEAIQLLIEKTLEEPGCIEFQVFQELDNDDFFVLWEKFESREALSFHMEQEYTKEYFSLGLVASTKVIKHKHV
ncbi:putative quinol monooxygenase [Teredinibacter sp. KSP-S5-2]|uniref:putative quinol monooxygenase n=1 Tax=Teredinibacter sp. KSP-S5-2 TaxID=3034506 RepID=UPI0029343EF6|nr:putative quinol monooxygenase [Teredinibacter sp. KSP-S5-2]WNO08498.1 putative quinol monooxygenase [Teredinibacter sp. KSP-S5-2]